MLDRIYFLTLNESTQRKNNVQRQINRLEKAGFDNCEMFKNYRFPAAIANTLKANFRPKMASGIYSCTTGHYAIMNDALQNGYEYIMVVEDDVCLSDRAIQFIKDFEIKYSILDFDCVKLWYSRYGMSWEKFNEYKYDWIDNELFRFRKLPKGTYIFGNLCYIVNRKYMKAYIEFYDEHIGVSDIATSDHDRFIDKYDLKIYLYKDTSMILGLNAPSSLTIS